MQLILRAQVQGLVSVREKKHCSAANTMSPYQGPRNDHFSDWIGVPSLLTSGKLYR